jgi:HlyD family secretion protein
MSEPIKSKRPWRRALKIVELSLSLVLIILLAAYFLQIRIGKRDEVPAVLRSDITIGEVRTGTYRDELLIEATVQPLQTVYLDFLEAGRVDKKFVEIGSIVREGDPILQLVNPALLMEIMSRETEVLQQANNIRNSRLSLDQYKLQLTQQLSEIDNQLQQQEKLYERYKELDKDSLISKHEFEKARDQYEYLLKRKDLMEKTHKSDLDLRTGQLQDVEEALRRLEANRDAVKLRLDNLTVKAPVPGQVTALDAELGQAKSAGQRLGQIDSFNGFKATAFIDESRIGRIDVGENGSFDIDDRSFNLIVKKIFPEVKGGKFEVELEFRGERPKTIKRGQTLHVHLDLSESIEALILDLGDDLKTGGGAWVYRIEADEKSAVRIPVKLGRRNAAVVEVLQGLRSGDRVILSSVESFGKADRLLLKEP